jgi:hypothetical protein
MVMDDGHFVMTRDPKERSEGGKRRRETQKRAEQDRDK